MNDVILMIDDDQENLESTSEYLSFYGYKVLTASGVEELNTFMASRSRPQISLVLMDYRLPGTDGAELTTRIRKVWPQVPVLIYSGDTSQDAARKSWGAGAVGFVPKDDRPEILANTIKSSIEANPVVWGDSSEDDEKNISKINSIGMIGVSQKMATVADQVHRYANHEDPVLILGESGTGKELIAKALANLSGKQLTVVNCAAYVGNAQLLESELFGYVKGSFTGAGQSKKGIIETAGSGIVFLDELHQLPLEAQPKLLRVIQEKLVRPIGAVKEVSTKARIIASAKPILAELTESEQFLADLFYRLNVLTIAIPALRDRREDIPVLARHFANEYSMPSSPIVLGNEAVAAMREKMWTGNTRELQNTIKFLAINCSGNVDAADLGERNSEIELKYSSYQEFRNEKISEEKVFIEKTLAKFNSNKKNAAHFLGIPPNTLHSIVKRLNIKGFDRSIQNRRLSLAKRSFGRNK